MADSIRRLLEKEEDQRLAPCALRSAEASRRLPIENEGRAFDYRTNFQRDRDRIVYSRAFRRLRHKAQAGILPAYEDHRRNRLTHSIEVAQLARTIGRALRLNEDLIEAIALGHDLGQPAFGPAGERALDDLMRGALDGRGGAGLGDLGGFWRSWQSLRVVDGIEKRYSHAGLNLTDPVREGLLKSGPADRTPPESVEGVRLSRPPLFEAQVVIVADRMAGVLHELDDALQAASVELAHVERLAAVRHLRRKLGPRYGSGGGRFMRSNAIHRGLVHLMVTSTVMASRRTLARWCERHQVRDARSFEAVREHAVCGDEIGLPPAGRSMLAEVERFVELRIRRGRAADRVDAQGRRVLLGLFAAYHADPALLDDHVLLRFKELSRRPFLRDVPRDGVEAEVASRYRGSPVFVRLLVDHLASMTDPFAREEHTRLLEFGAVPIPSAEQLRRERSVPD